MSPSTICRSITIGRVEDSMGLTVACLKNLASLDNGGGLRFARIDRDGPTQHVERVADNAVKVPRHLFARRENQMTDLNLVSRDPLNPRRPAQPFGRSVVPCLVCPRCPTSSG
jgi:hypothetical protein